jgi:hypothetical protein
MEEAKTGKTKTWVDRIAAARQREQDQSTIGTYREGWPFTAEDEDLAASWVTCACGEQDPLVPRWDGHGEYETDEGRLVDYAPGQPKDGRLFRLGLLFSRHVNDGEVNAAERVLEEIQERAVEVIEIEKQKLNHKLF